MIGASVASLVLLGLQAVLTTPGGGQAAFDSSRHKVNVAVFSSTVCPVAADYYPRLAEVWRTFGARRDVGFYVVFPNKTESLADLQAHAAEMRFPFPVYRDENNRLADALEARVTPTAVVTGSDGMVFYRGAIDDATNPARVRRSYLSEAIEAALAGRRPPRPPVAAGQPFG